MVIIREALPDDLSACTILRPTYTTRAVWQLTIEHNIHPSSTTTTVSDYISELRVMHFRLRQNRLPRLLSLTLPSATVPLEEIWLACSARFIALDDSSETTTDTALLQGYLLLQTLPAQQQALIVQLLVDQPARRKGVGTALVRAARDWAIAHRLKGLLCHTPLRNTVGTEFYLRCGFRICGLSERFYPTREDALLLERSVEQ